MHWQFHDLLDAVFELVELLLSDVVYGDGRAVAEIASRVDLLLAEVTLRIERDDWAPREL
jgi:hypothetical protein